jgi:hypothetical protein
MPAVLEPLSWEQYEAIAAEHWSRLKLMLKSPAHYKANAEDTGEDEDTDSRILGRVFHLLTLEPQLAETRLAIWEGKVRRGKEWDSFMLANPGKEWIRAKEFSKAKSMADSARLAFGSLLKDGKAEHSVRWMQDDIPCKARPDYAKPEVIFDLKSTTDASPHGFGAQAARLGYHCQAAMYVDAMAAVDGVLRNFVLLACESSAPYVCAAYLVQPHQLEAGREKYRRLLAELQACKQLDTWPGYTQGVAELQFPE